MANGNGLNLSWWQIIVLIMSIGGSFVAANVLGQSKLEAAKEEIRVEQKEKHDKIDKKFEVVMSEVRENGKEMQGINIRLERVVTLLEERTHE